MAKGKVILVGAGPGDPGLITRRGLAALREADLVVFDALIPLELLNEARPGCRLVDVGKRSGRHTLEQGAISRLLIQGARQGKWVVRLKGGDPFIFGRGGEEGEALARAGIPFEVIPGLTSATAVPAYAGIPLTHRDYNTAVAFLAGHGIPGPGRGRAAPVDWNALAHCGTLVILMGVAALARNMRALVAAGKDLATPVAVIQWGTLAGQKTVIGTVRTIAARVKAAHLGPPAVVIVGENVTLKKTLNWFESKPLFGKRILVTRAREQASELSERFRSEGAIPIEIPTVAIEPPRSFGPLDRAIARLSNFDWLLFTSANGAHAFFDRLAVRRRDARALAGLKIAAVGPGTARPLIQYGVRADLVATTHRAEGLLAKLTARTIRGRRILLMRAERARELLPETLRRRGARVTIVPCYRSVAPRESRSELHSLFDHTPPDLLSFASSSMVKNFVALLGDKQGRLRRAKKIPAACIGPVTSETARRLGFKTIIAPKQSTIPDLVAAIAKATKRRGGN